VLARQADGTAASLYLVVQDGQVAIKKLTDKGLVDALNIHVAAVYPLGKVRDATCCARHWCNCSWRNRGQPGIA